jgi:hypothetical protein
MMKRREFLTAGSGLVAAAGLAPAYLIAATPETLDIRAVEFGTGLSRTKFEALLNQTFYLHYGTSGVLFVRLIRVKEKATPVNPEQFSLFFQGPTLPSLPAGSYEMEHYLAGHLSLYLEPSQAAGSDPLYRADLSLLH